MQTCYIVGLIVTFAIAAQAWPDPPCRKPPLAVNYTVEQVSSIRRFFLRFDLLLFSTQADGSKSAKFKQLGERFSNGVVNVRTST